MRISVIVPAYNEERRLGPFLDAFLAFRDAGKHDWGILVVDDGSADGTAALARGKGVRVLSLPSNRGKGAAVREGFAAAAKEGAERLLFLDADGSVAPAEIPKAIAALDSADVAVGVRKGEVRQPGFRTLSRKGLAAYIRLLFGAIGSDCLCGLKAFRREAAAALFADLRSERWIFDVEILAKARRANLRVAEIPIGWEYCAGSKMRPWTPIRIAWDLARLRLKSC